MSGVDGNSTEGESACGRGPAQTGPGCYRNYEHYSLARHRRSASSYFPSLPNDLPTTPDSPNRRLLDFAQSVPGTQNDDYYNDDVPAQHANQGNATPSEYKEFRDAENIMPLATSDFRTPICQEMKSLRSAVSGDQTFQQQQFFAVEMRPSPAQTAETTNYGKMYNEQGSVDSSDTYASCQTHPSHSQGDLTEEGDSNLYVNPLEVAEKCGNRVKNSPSGDGIEGNVNDASPSVESLKDVRPFNESGRPNETVPKHRKIRIQQSVRHRAQFISDQENAMARAVTKESTVENDYYGGLRGGGRPFPSNANSSLASATRIINDRLFGPSGVPRHYTGTNNESKLSLSADSIDSEGVSFVDRHRNVSKSILKKSESSNNYYSNVGDSDTEKLIADNVSTTTSTCDIFGNLNGSSRMKQPVSPLLSRQGLEAIFRASNNNLDREYETEQQLDEKNGGNVSTKSIFDDDVLEGNGRYVLQEEATTEVRRREDRRKTRTRLEVPSKDNQTTLISSLRSHKGKRLNNEEKRKGKTSGNGCKPSDVNCLPQEQQHRFTS